MDIKPVSILEKKQFNQLATHPLQSWEWGEFREKTGIKVLRLGRYANNKLIETAQITFHPIPFTSYKIGYFPKGPLPSEIMLQALYQIGKENNCLFIKLEPNIEKNNPKFSLSDYHLPIKSSPHPLFTKYTFNLDLTKTEEELLSLMHPKTRYNIRIAQKHGVTIEESNSEEAFNEYLRLTCKTTKRQKFYAHGEKYHQMMWTCLKKPGMAHLLIAKYQNEILVTWIVFLFNSVLYYPYGASSDKFRNTMASTLMMWEGVRFGKKNGAKSFDLWGSLGPNPNPSDPWFGFHKFKKGFNPQLVEYIGSFDLIINPLFYNLYNFAYKIRRIFLNLRK